MYLQASLSPDEEPKGRERTLIERIGHLEKLNVELSQRCENLTERIAQIDHTIGLNGPR